LGVVAPWGLSLILLAVDVAGTTECPPPGDVAAELDALTPSPTGAGVALLSSELGGLRVRLVRDGGALVGERLLPSGYGCRELARAAALVLASWQGALVRTPILVPPVATLRERGEVDAKSRAVWQVRAGLFADAPADVTPGAWAELAVAREPSGLGLALSAAASGFHSETAGAGQIRWMRLPLMLMARQRVASAGPFSLEAGAGAAGALLLLRGSGFEVNYSSVKVDFGPAASLRLARRWDRLAAWAGAAGVIWLRPRVAYLLPDESRHSLPRAGVWLGLGLSWQISMEQVQGPAAYAH
jgi:hypothetical protein